MELALKSRLGAASLQAVQLLDIAVVYQQFEILLDAADTKAVIAHKYECVLS